MDLLVVFGNLRFFKILITESNPLLSRLFYDMPRNIAVDVLVICLGQYSYTSFGSTNDIFVLYKFS